MSDLYRVSRPFSCPDGDMRPGQYTDAAGVDGVRWPHADRLIEQRYLRVVDPAERQRAESAVGALMKSRRKRGDKEAA